MGTIITGAIVAAVVGLVIWKMVRDKKNGKGSCSCGGNCASCGTCQSCGAHTPKPKNK